MSSYTISLKAYSKIILHCCKYPHKELNGVVIGSISKETQTVQIQDCIPLFHLGIGLTPMLEVALTQVVCECVFVCVCVCVCVLRVLCMHMYVVPGACERCFMTPTSSWSCVDVHIYVRVCGV